VLRTDAVEGYRSLRSVVLDKQLGQTVIAEQMLLDRPQWHWPAR
jgi:hypothetical protein